MSDLLHRIKNVCENSELRFSRGGLNTNMILALLAERGLEPTKRASRGEMVSLLCLFAEHSDIGLYVCTAGDIVYDLVIRSPVGSVAIQVSDSNIVVKSKDGSILDPNSGLNLTTASNSISEIKLDFSDTRGDDSGHLVPFYFKTLNENGVGYFSEFCDLVTSKIFVIYDLLKQIVGTAEHYEGLNLTEEQAKSNVRLIYNYIKEEFDRKLRMVYWRKSVEDTRRRKNLSRRSDAIQTPH